MKSVQFIKKSIKEESSLLETIKTPACESFRQFFIYKNTSLDFHLLYNTYEENEIDLEMEGEQKKGLSKTIFGHGMLYGENQSFSLFGDNASTNIIPIEISNNNFPMKYRNNIKLTIFDNYDSETQTYEERFLLEIYLQDKQFELFKNECKEEEEDVVIKLNNVNSHGIYTCERHAKLLKDFHLVENIDDFPTDMLIKTFYHRGELHFDEYEILLQGEKLNSH